MRGVFYNSMTSFKENAEQKKKWQDYCDENHIDYSEFIRQCVYDKIKVLTK